MIKLWKQLGANLIVVYCKWVQNKGQLELLQDPEKFTEQNGGPYDTPVQQLTTYPNIQNGTITSDCERMRAKILRTNATGIITST